jgi:para-aminobenzoate synthetase component 1
VFPLDRDKAMSLIARGQRLPLHVRRLPGPVDPFAAFAPFAGEPGAVLLHSAFPHARFGRHTIWAARPVAVLAATGDEIAITRGGRTERRQGDPFDALADLLDEFRQPPANLPVPFAGGLIGYLGYDLGRRIERIPEKALKDDGFPDLWLGVYDASVCLDALAGELVLTGREGFNDRDSLDRRMADLADASWAALGAAPPVHAPTPSPAHALTSNFTRDAYLDAIARAKSHIAAGDIYQVNLSQRFETRLDAASPFDLYRRLCAASPAPFAAFLNLGKGRAVLSASPERFLLLDGRRVETRPIKGTRPRGATPADDARLRAELEASEKDKAELVMIVDLERNDLGRVCETGSVEVSEPRVIETYAQVHHGVATVRGTLRAGAGAVELLRATFPGGSITGAPKVRAMEIIEDLEPTRRGVYTGAIGYIGFDGGLDLSIAIRTLLVEGTRVTFQAGGGIVADSEPEAEYEETRVKASGMMKALGI